MRIAIAIMLLMLFVCSIGFAQTFRTVTGVVPGSKARIEFIEFKGVKGTPFDLRMPDPGASGMAIRVESTN